MTIALVLPSGEHLELEVVQVEFVRYCKLKSCRMRFQTIDPDQLYCQHAHMKSDSRRRCALRALGKQITLQ